MDENRADRQARGDGDRNADPSQSGGGVFEIRVKGHLNRQWSDWLGGLEMRLLDNGETILSGTIVDQAALLGILNNLNRLNLTLVSVRSTHSSNTGDKNEQHPTLE
jgi:hypothetical protein